MEWMIPGAEFAIDPLVEDFRLIPVR